MLYKNALLSGLLLIILTQCSAFNKDNADTKDSTVTATAKSVANTDGVAASNGTAASAAPPKGGNSIYGIWGHGLIKEEDLNDLPFLKGWNIIYTWRDLEPQEGKINWDYFDQQLKMAADHNLNIGFMIWVGQYSPDWVYAKGVPKVQTTNNKENGFPFYLNATYKQAYFNMLKQVAEHVKTLPFSTRKLLVYWMSAEGSTGDETPYKGKPIDAQYNISDEQWFAFKKDVWKYMYDFGESITPKVNLLVNQGNNRQYFDWLVSNLPKVWVKAGNVSHTYQFNGELEYFQRLQKLVAKTDTDSSSSRIRGELTIHGKWFAQAPHWNTYALLTSCLHFGLDIFNARTKYLDAAKDTIAFNLFNEYAGQKNPAKATGAFCFFRDGLDAADTKRFPEAKYGALIDPSQAAAYKAALQNLKGDDDEEDENSTNGDETQIDDATIKQSNLLAQYINKDRVENILKEFASYGAKAATLNDAPANDDNVSDDNSATTDDNTDARAARRNANPNKIARNPNRQRNPNRPVNPNRNPNRERKQNKAKKGSDYQEKRESNMIINDIGVNLLPDNYSRYLTQYAPDATSRGYWRVGPMDQPYGRFARGFDNQSGMKEMFFSLNKRFYNSTAAQNPTVRIIYFDKGNGSWSLNYYNGSAKTQAYTITCNNTNRWIVKTVTLQGAYFTQKLENNTDLSIKYISGDNTIFNSIEVLR